MLSAKEGEKEAKQEADSDFLELQSLSYQAEHSTADFCDDEEKDIEGSVFSVEHDFEEIHKEDL